jgi:hypothetical protein
LVQSLDRAEGELVVGKRKANESETVLGRRRLNRALLARQMLLERTAMPAIGAISHLVGMQAQSPLAPYVGLWSRLVDFDAGELVRLIEERQAVRMPLMRTTLHLVSAADALRIRPLVQPVMERGFFTCSPFGKKLGGIDIDAVLDAGRKELVAKPATSAELLAVLGKRWPEYDAESLGHAVRLLVPVVQTPPRGIFGKGGLPIWTPLENWLGKPLDGTCPIEELALRYLGAFGPASIMDFQAWSWLTRQAGTFERLRPKLVTFGDEAGRELFDLPDAPRPDQDTPAPVRFIPEYDNLLLSHADRGRVVTEEQLKRIFVKGGLLVDGFATGAWKIARTKGQALLEIETFRKLSKRDTPAVEAEGARLLKFASPGAKAHAIRIIAG